MSLKTWTCCQFLSNFWVQHCHDFYFRLPRLSALCPTSSLLFFRATSFHPHLLGASAQCPHSWMHIGVKQVPGQRRCRSTDCLALASFRRAASCGRGQQGGHFRGLNRLFTVQGACFFVSVQGGKEEEKKSMMWGDESPCINLYVDGIIGK